MLSILNEYDAYGKLYQTDSPFHIIMDQLPDHNITLIQFVQLIYELCSFHKYYQDKCAKFIKKYGDIDD